jgi:hypothetical protein
MRYLLLSAKAAKSNFNRKYDQELRGTAGTGCTVKQFWDIKTVPQVKCILVKGISMVQVTKSRCLYHPRPLFNILQSQEIAEEQQLKPITEFFYLN